MAQTRAAGSGPIPPAKKDDSEDVAWALSTAEAMYARGDRGDALKWLRRAAESASEAQADDRALELAKAAAELASVLGPSPSAPPPPPAAANAAAAPPPQRAPVPTRVAAPPPPPPTPAAVPAATAPAPVAPPPPLAPAPSAAAGMRPKPPVRPAPAPAVTPVAPRIVETRRPRRSRPEIQLTRPIDEVTQVTTPPAQPVARRRRASRPPADESAPPPTTRRSDRPTALAVPSAAEIDAWPTESPLGDLESIAPDPDEKTRIGVPAYDPNAPAPAELPSSPVVIEDPSIRSSQAVRVIVWRAADGVHIAPHGTRVAAITVDAVLVALDPSADLTAWLTGK